LHWEFGKLFPSIDVLCLNPRKVRQWREGRPVRSWAAFIKIRPPSTVWQVENGAAQIRMRAALESASRAPHSVISSKVVFSKPEFRAVHVSNDNQQFSEAKSRCRFFPYSVLGN
jgi:hypothetical protein